VAVLVLQPFAVERRASRGAAEQDAAATALAAVRSKAASP
jgi:hypothetical protein